MTWKEELYNVTTVQNWWRILWQLTTNNNMYGFIEIIVDGALSYFSPPPYCCLKGKTSRPYIKSLALDYSNSVSVGRVLQENMKERDLTQLHGKLVDPARTLGIATTINPINKPCRTVST